ncbi:MAG: tRNA dihydrouridine synthase DusB [Candidatus Nanopelagicales bacterium]|nr:tRNA dihydrouridine synthase DusB [Actinomycetota bacterium]HNL51157.1 tRNA dihydrouridine synthase DusB [Actinomycetota bacterium]HUM86507.1 tRNA dihydrouridine synthase DusB [Actinomycetota bacterium]
MLSPLRIGGTELPVPVVLAPMAGVTNRAFRRMCREYGAGLYVSEMVTSRALVERNAETLAMCAFGDEESPRSIQLYGVDPDVMGRAVRMVADDDMADHIDLNMGCPVPKVTRKGGGAALPWKLDLFRSIVRAAVRNADGRPVTVKMRKGIDDEHLTYRDAARIAADEGVEWVALHARTAQQMYSGQADWEAIGNLVQDLYPLPVLGNGDIWTAQDAVDMMQATGCAGVVIGRGCLGRPWLFGQLAHRLGDGSPVPDPTVAQVCAVLREHAGLLVETFGEHKGCQEIRKHIAWYFKGYAVRQHLRLELAHVSTLAELDDLLEMVAERDPEQVPPVEVLSAPRGRTSRLKRVALPEGWLDSREVTAGQEESVRQAELSVSGG